VKSKSHEALHYATLISVILFRANDQVWHPYRYDYIFVYRDL